MTANKKGLIITVIAVIIMLAIIVTAIFILIPKKENDEILNDGTVVANVDGTPIVFAELCLAAEDIRSEVISYFYNTYSAVQSEDFWTLDFNGETPNLKFYTLALEEAVRIKTEQIMFKDYKIAEDISYKTFYDQFIAENKRRAEALENDEIIYGPQQYSIDSYFDYIHNNRLLKLKAEINKEVTDSDELSYTGDNFDIKYKEKRAKVTVETVKEVEELLKQELNELYK